MVPRFWQFATHCSTEHAFATRTFCALAAEIALKANVSKIVKMTREIRSTGDPPCKMSAT